MKKIYLFPCLILLLLLAACSGGTAAPTAAPAASLPTVIPTIAPAVTQPPAIVKDQTGLTGTTWMWIGFTNPIEQVAVESPMNYSLVFQEDGTVNIKADCNTAQGSYQVDGKSIRIQVGAMTRAMCPAGSHSDEFIKYLGSAAIYFFQDGQLYIDLMADGGTMVLAPSEVVMADDGEGALSGALWANPWQWVSFTDPVQQYDVENPGNYVLTFHEDGTVEIKADCNTAKGTYSTTDGSKISIVVGPVTLAACPPGSRSDEMIKHLGFAAIYFFQDGKLFMDLMADGGTMQFSPEPAGNS